MIFFCDHKTNACSIFIMSDGNMQFIRTHYWSKKNKFLTASANHSIDLKGFDQLKTLCVGCTRGALGLKNHSYECQILV